MEPIERRWWQWWLVWLAGGVLLLGGGLWWRLHPWWNAATTPIVVVLETAAETAIEVVWAEGEAPLPLVPVDAGADGRARQWTTELPPRPEYQLGLRFPEGVEDGRLRVGRVYRLIPFREEIAQRWAEQATGWETEAFTAIERTNAGIVFTASAGARLDWSEPVSLSPGVLSGAGLKALSVFLLGVFLGVGLIFAGLRFPERLPAPSVRPGRRWDLITVLVFLGTAGLFVYFVEATFPVYWVNDSTSYVDKALSWWQRGTFDSGGYEYELNRTPGYPWLIAQAFALFGAQLEAVPRLQAALALVSFGALFAVMRGWLRPWALALAIPLVLLSPPVVWGARLLATESTFVSLWALGTAVFLWAWRREGRWRLVGLVLFGLIVAANTLVRANAVLMLVLPGCAGVGLVTRWLLARQWRRWAGLLGTGLPLIIPFAFVVVVNVALAWWNFQSRGYARPSDLAPAVAANESFNSGMLDVRALADEAEYVHVVSERWKRGYFFPGWGLRHYRFVQLTNQQTQFDQTTVGALADTVFEFAATNRSLLPWEAKAVAWWRVLYWGLWLPDRGPSTQDGLQRVFRLETGFEKPHQQRELEKRLKWLSRAAPKLTYTEDSGSWAISAYNALVPGYRWIYRLLSLGAIGGLAWAAWRGRGIALACFAPFFVNVLLNVYLLYIVDRYVQVLDGMLIVGWLSLLALAPRKGG